MGAEGGSRRPRRSRGVGERHSYRERGYCSPSDHCPTHGGEHWGDSAANIIADATPYGGASGHHATVEAAAKQHLTAAEYTAVIQRAARFNSEPATLANTATSPVLAAARLGSPQQRRQSDGRLRMELELDQPLVGWTFWMNDCAVDVIEGLSCTVAV